MSDRALMLSLLQQMEMVMHQHRLWEPVSPPPEAFESRLPFCVDTMKFSQWLQWIFIARFRALLQGGLPLPSQCNVSVMAEEAFKGVEPDMQELIELLRQFDQQFE